MRALLVVVVAAVVAIFVLARLTSSPSAKPVAVRSSTTTLVPRRSATTTTTVPAATTTSTTVPATTTTTLAPSSVTVAVLNGYTTAHGALFFQKQLAAKGYDTRAPANALTDTNKTSLVFYTSPAYRANALAIAADLSLSASSVVAPTTANDTMVPAYYLSGTDIILMIGADISTRVPANYTG
jgi:hypothetical protein